MSPPPRAQAVPRVVHSHSVGTEPTSDSRSIAQPPQVLADLRLQLAALGELRLELRHEPTTPGQVLPFCPHRSSPVRKPIRLCGVAAGVISWRIASNTA